MNKNSKGRVSLARALSKLGIASRTEAIALIQAGKVKVHGSAELNPDRMINPDTAHVEISEKKVIRATPQLFAFHKPVGVLTTKRDPEGRTTIFNLLPPELQNFHAVGRLDKQTSGLLLLTNDTKISHFLTEPSNSVERIYEVLVRGEFTEENKAACIAGFEDEGENLKAHGISILSASIKQTQLSMTLIQGKNREVRRLCQGVAHEVISLHRVRYGDFTLGRLAPGNWKELSLGQLLLKSAACALQK